MKTLMLVATLLLSNLAFGGTITLSWTPPLLNDDGSELTDLAGYMAYASTSPGGEAVHTWTLDDPTAESWLIDDVPPGAWWITLVAVDDTGNSSDESNTVFKQVIGDDPFDTVSTKAWTLHKEDGRIVWLVIGSVPLGTLCNPAENANGRFAIPADAVDYGAGNIRPKVVFGDCS